MNKDNNNGNGHSNDNDSAQMRLKLKDLQTALRHAHDTHLLIIETFRIDGINCIDENIRILNNNHALIIALNHEISDIMQAIYHRRISDNQSQIKLVE